MRFSVLVTAILITIGATATALGGSLTPPAGPIAPTPGPEPRTPINATNTPGDANSVFKITAPGSYYLTGNATGVVGKHGIEIEASGVTLDLMGFELLGVPGSLDGVNATSGTFTSIEVRNGSVRFWGGHGVEFLSSLNRSCRFSALRATNNGGDGLRIGVDSIVTGCNGSNNGGDGIDVDGGSIVLECTASGNAADGFVMGGAGMIKDCIAHTNTGDGISVGSDCLVTGNTCRLNGFGAGSGAGIHVTNGDNRIEGNNCTDADRGIDVDAAGNIIIRNTCAANATNYDFVANNVYGPIIDRTAPGSGVVSGNSAVSSLGSTDPNANYAY